MRADHIIVSGPFEIPPLFVDEYVDEDGTVVPEHVLDMGHMRRMIFESRACACGQIHGYTLDFQWQMMLAYPEFAEHALEAGAVALVRAMEACDAKD